MKSKIRRIIEKEILENIAESLKLPKHPGLRSYIALKLARRSPFFIHYMLEDEEHEEE